MKKVVVLIVLMMAIQGCKKKADRSYQPPAPVEQQEQVQKEVVEEDKCAPTKITVGSNVFTTTQGQCYEMDGAVTKIKLDSGKYIWIGNNFLVEQQ